MQTVPTFSPLRENLEKDSAVIYVLNRGLRIVFCNEAWDRFAMDNGGQGLERHRQVGRSVMDSVPTPLKRFFEDGYGTVLSSGQTWEHCYECSSANVYRTFRMRSTPDPEGDGLVVMNSILVERRHDHRQRRVRLPDRRLDADYQGIVTMCSHCRRIRRVGQTDVWDWVPAYLVEPPDLISHGMCAVCMDLFYPEFPDQPSPL